MKIHELTVTSIKDRKRVGRGIGSGTGKTAGRGTKGQNSRSGGGVRPGFEGGQNPLAKRLPKKRGFRSLSTTPQATVPLDRLNAFKASATVTATDLALSGTIGSPHMAVKIVAGGELTKKLTVRLQGATKTAREAIVAAGGSFEAVPVIKSPKKPSKRNRTQTAE
jgi:large subunit ribosomal protein L15